MRDLLGVDASAARDLPADEITGSFDNAGTLIASGTSTINGPVTNTGTINVIDGTLALSGGTYGAEERNP